MKPRHSIIFDSRVHARSSAKRRDVLVAGVRRNLVARTNSPLVRLLDMIGGAL